MDMLPRRHREIQAPVLPISRIRNVQSTQNEGQQNPPLAEAEAKEGSLPETDAVMAEIREMDSGEIAAGELGDSVKKLEVRPSGTAMQTGGLVAELQDSRSSHVPTSGMEAEEAAAELHHSRSSQQSAGQ